MGGVTVTWYGDPACPRCWSAEPQRRWLEHRYGETLPPSWVMTGLARRIEEPLAMLADWLDATAASAMPVDARVWLGSAPSSSYPACLAVKAAAEQGLDGSYLRRAREGFAVDRLRLDNRDALLSIAGDVPGLNLARFANDLDSHAVVEAFGEDLERARRAPVPTAPRAVFTTADGATEVVELPASTQELSRAAERAGARQTAEAPDVLEALRRFGRMATTEVAAVCELAGPLAPASLYSLASEWKVRAEGIAAAQMWRAV